jgi:hypothetical protein
MRRRHKKVQPFLINIWNTIYRITDTALVIHVSVLRWGCFCLDAMHYGLCRLVFYVYSKIGRMYHMMHKQIEIPPLSTVNGFPVLDHFPTQEARWKRPLIRPVAAPSLPPPFLSEAIDDLLS